MPSFFDTNGLMLPNHSRVDYRGGKKFQQRTRDCVFSISYGWDFAVTAQFSIGTGGPPV